jgi:hypothetical protein
MVVAVTSASYVLFLSWDGWWRVVVPRKHLFCKIHWMHSASSSGETSVSVSLVCFIAGRTVLGLLRIIRSYDFVGGKKRLWPAIPVLWRNYSRNCLLPGFSDDTNTFSWKTSFGLLKYGPEGLCVVNLPHYRLWLQIVRTSCFPYMTSKTGFFFTTVRACFLAFAIGTYHSFCCIWTSLRF